MVTTKQTLSTLPFFAQLSENALREIASHIQERTFSPGQVIIVEGTPCQAVYVVARGLVRSCRLSLEGREHVLGYLGPGRPFNIVAALDGGVNSATVDAATEAMLYSIPCGYFRLMMRDHQEVALAVSEYLAAEVRRLGDMVENLALHTVRTRLARFLLTHAEGTQMPQRQWTQEEIAGQIGTVREMVGRTLRAFATEGLIRRQRGRIAVLNREGLAREGAVA
jgi:CRP/FNR family cyclic AMP-dependent transcriptional regulator